MVPDTLSAHGFERWQKEEQTEALAEELLKPFEIEGIVFASDTVGMSRMSREHPLPRVLKRLHGPKERIHRMATGLGGRALGTWFADNTATLFPMSNASNLLRGMASVHRDGPVRIGIAAHAGRFWCIDGELHGPEAEHVHRLAENHCGGGETRITRAFEAMLTDTDGLWIHATTQTPVGPSRQVEVLALAPAGTGSPDYPLPYGRDVHKALMQLETAADVEAFDARWREQRVVMVAWCPPAATETASDTLTTLVNHSRFRTHAARILPAERKLWHGLALAAFPNEHAALQGAQDLRSACQADDLELCIGIDEGPTYLFPMDVGYEFAGDPVNRGSKLAEDLAQSGMIAITARAADDLEIPLRSMKYQVSGIEIDVRLC